MTMAGMAGGVAHGLAVKACALEVYQVSSVLFLLQTREEVSYDLLRNTGLVM